MSTETTTPAVDFDLLLNPRTIAVVGASADPGGISGLPQRLMAQHGYRGQVYPVNPRHTEIDGVACYPSIAAVPGPVDVALIVVNAATVADVLAQCGCAGVRFAVIISSGFAEQYDGAERQRLLRAVLDDYPQLRVIGPNSEGLMNVRDAIPVGFSPTIDYNRGLRRLIGGDVAVIAQSGGLGFALFNDGQSRGLGFSYVITTGNEADLDLVDLAGHLVHDSLTRVLLLFIEGVDRPERLTALADAARRRGKSIVVAKAGSSQAGKRAALAHTAHHTDIDRELDLAVREHGVLRAYDQEELVDLALVLSRTRTPAGLRTGIVTTSGGSGTWLADDLCAAGLSVPLLSAPLQQQLRTMMPAYGSPANPVDATAQVLGRGGIAPVLRVVADSGEVDALVLIATLADPAQLDRERETLSDVAARMPLVVYSYTRPAERSVELLRELGIAYFTSGRRTARALAALSGVG